MHIGKEIERVYNEKGLKIAIFAEKLGTFKDNIYKIFKREDISTSLLLKISEILEFDFFKFYTKHNNTDNTQIDYLITENKLLKDQVDLQKKYINSLEKNIKKNS
jgi:predicted transcriptional regulator